LKRNGTTPGKRKQKPSEIEQLASNPATDAVRVEQLLRAMRSIAELADAALRDDHRLLYFAQLARQVETAATPQRSDEPRNEAKDAPLKAVLPS
jgi:hypothetical protein